MRFYVKDLAISQLFCVLHSFNNDGVLMLKQIIEYLKSLEQYDHSIYIGDQLVYKGLTHGSVGVSFVLEYDKTAFKENRTYSYTDPNIAIMPGGDEEIAICTLTALKAGKFVIKEIENYRGEEITVKAVHVIKVQSR